MYKQKQISWRLVSKQISSVFLFVIMFLTPSIVFAQWNVTQNDLTATAAFDTVYQNTNSYPRFVSVSANNNSSAIVTYTVSVDNSAIPAIVVSTNRKSATTQIISFTFEIPPGYYYQVADSSGASVVVSWVEWDNEFVSSGGSATSSIISNPNQDLFNGFIIFFICLIFIIWFFKKN